MSKESVGKAMPPTEYDIPPELAGQRFTGRIRHTSEGWYVASCDEVPGALTQGTTLEEARSNLREAIMLMIEDMSPEEVSELAGRLSDRDRGEHLESIAL